MIGVPRAYFFENLDAEIAERVEVALDCLASSGFVVSDVEVRVDEDRTLQKAEAFEFHRQMVAEHGDLYDVETRRRILSGKDVTPEQRQAALRGLAHERENIATLFHGIDVLITPTTPVPAPTIFELLADPKALRPADGPAAQHETGKRLGIAGDLVALRVQLRWIAHRIANYWTAARGDESPSGRARIRTRW